MLFSLATTAAALASLASFATAVDTNFKACEEGPFASPASAGRPWADTAENIRWCEAGLTDGDVLTGMRIWRGDWQIKGVQLKWGSHDFGPVHGQKTSNDPDAEKEWDASSKVVIKLWHNKPDDGDPIDAVGKISIEVDGQEPVEAHAKKFTSDEIIADTAAEMILAVSGAQGLWLDTLQIMYLESSIVSTSMSSISFGDSVDKYNKDQQGLEPAVIGNIYIVNSNEKGGLNQTYGMTTTITKTKSKSITSQQSHSFGVKLGFEISATVEVPLLAEITAKTSTEYSYNYETMTSKTDTETETWTYLWNIGSTSTGIPPQSAVHCTAVATSGTFDSTYTAKIAARLDNGKIFEYNDSGDYNSVGWADGISGCPTIPISEVPQDEMLEANGKTISDPEKIQPARRGLTFVA